MAKSGVNEQAHLLRWKFHICTSTEKLIGSHFNCSDNNLSSCAVCCLCLAPEQHLAKVVSFDAFLELLGSLSLLELPLGKS